MNHFWNTLVRLRFVLISIVALGTYGCGSSGNSTDTTTTAATTPAAVVATPKATTVTGTAATGKALAGALVTLTDSKGASKTATTSATGKYTIDVTDMTPPFVVTVSGTQGGVTVSMVSVAYNLVTSTTNVVNVTTLTTVIAAKLSPTGLAKDLSPARDKATIVASLTTEETYVSSLIQTTLTDAGLAADASAISTPFDADGTGYDSIYDNLQVGQSSKGDIFVGPRCTAQIVKINGKCTEYSNPSDQTTTNPNLCGFDIATGAGIPCDPTRATTEKPSATLPAIDAAGGVSVGGAGITFGPKTTTPPPNPLTLVTVACTPGTSGCKTSTTTTTTTSTVTGSASLPDGYPTNVPLGLYVISGSVCATYVGCTTIPSQTVENKDAAEFSKSVVSAFKAGASSAASSGCSQSQSYTPYSNGSFSGSLKTTCTSGGASAYSTVTLSIRKK